MKVGDRISATVNGEPLVLTLDEYVPYEPSCYHYDPGFWAGDKDDRMFFISEDGTVYGHRESTDPCELDAWDVAVGKVA